MKPFFTYLSTFSAYFFFNQESHGVHLNITRRDIKMLIKNAIVQTSLLSLQPLHTCQLLMIPNIGIASVLLRPASNYIQAITKSHERVSFIIKSNSRTKNTNLSYQVLMSFITILMKRSPFYTTAAI
jgi:hypothetical protein